MPRTIIICANSSWNLANYRSGLIRALISGGYNVIALAPRDASTDAVVALGCRFIELPMNPSATDIFSNLRLLQRFIVILHRERPDYFFGFTIKPNIFGSLAARMLGIRYINNITGLGKIFAGGMHFVSLTKLLYKYALGEAQVVFFQNPDDRYLFQTWGIVKHGRVDLLPGSGVNLEHFQYRTPLPAFSQTKPSQPISFIFVSRMLRDKGVFQFYEAARVIHEIGKKAEFKLLGPVVDGPEGVPRATIEKWHKEGIITYLGETDDVREFVLASDCVVLPTFYREGVPRALIEGAAMGRPLIATDIAGCREIVFENKNGLLVEPRSVEDLVCKMRMLIEMSGKTLNRMGASGREIVEDGFNEEIVIDKYMEKLAIQ